MAEKSPRKGRDVHRTPPIPKQGRFAAFAQQGARLAGKPVTFFAAVALVVVWAGLGPLFDYSETWQLFINTTTTIVTFLMVFLIQNTQNRDALAVQVKLAELITRMPGAPNRLADAEDMSESQLDALHAHYKAVSRRKSKQASRKKRDK